MLTLVVFVAFMLWRFSNAEDRRFILTILIIGIISRVIVYSILGFISILAGRAGWLGGVEDSLGIHNYAWSWAQQLQGLPKGAFIHEALDGHLYIYPYLFKIKGLHQYGFSGFTYLLGTVYYFFGPLKFSARVLNYLMGVGSGIFIYYIVKDIFGKQCARLSAVLTIFIPSLFLWSLTFMKDIAFIFAGSIMLWSFLKFQKTKRVLFLFILIVAILAQSTIRVPIPIFPIILIFILSYFVASGMSGKKKITILICSLILMSPLILRINAKERLNRRMVQVLNYSRGVVWTGGSTYKVFDDKYYPGGSLGYSDYISFTDFIKGFFKAWFYFLLTPFPWKTYTKFQLISYPQVILQYLLIPFVIVGMLISVRHKWKETFVIFTYIIILGSIVALTSGNIGTVFRHRDMLTPLFLIFASVGLIKTFGRLQLGSPQLERTE